MSLLWFSGCLMKYRHRATAHLDGGPLNDTVLDILKGQDAVSPTRPFRFRYRSFRPRLVSTFTDLLP